MTRIRSMLAVLVLTIAASVPALPAYAEAARTDQAARWECIGGVLKNRTDFNLWWGSNLPTPRYPYVNRLRPHTMEHVSWCHAGHSTFGNYIWARGDCQTTVSVYGGGGSYVIDHIGERGAYHWVRYRFPGRTIRDWCPRG